jgi:hypothetical protein
MAMSYEEKRVRNRAAVRKYRQTEKGRSVIESYQKSPKFKAIMHKYNTSEVGRKKCRDYRRSEKGKKASRDYISSEIGIIKRKAYTKSKKAIDNRRKSRLWGDYRITEHEYTDMLDLQNGRCCICGHTNKSGKKLFVDHDHDTGKIRGLLCARCNIALGMLRESFPYADNLCEYILDRC